MNTRILIVLALTGIFTLSCKKEYNKFDRPVWLEGKLYTQMLTIPDIDTFSLCVALSGYDTIIDASGSYTVFAPDNQAFQAYFAANTSYSNVADIPHEELLDLVKIHIIQNPWSKSQLKKLDVNGWINPRDPNNDEPWGYKRQTLLRDANRKYWITLKQNQATIVDSTQGSDTRLVFNSSRKYLPLFFDEYLDIAEVTGSDYEFFFDRSFENGNIYFSNAKIGAEDYFAENGFIYKLDEVVNPLKNTEEYLEKSAVGNNYTEFLNSIYLFPRFAENLPETFKQPGAEEGLDVPTLYNLDYPELVYDIHEELTGRNIVDVRNTVRYHYGMIAPTNAAMKVLIDEVITDNSGYPHWPSYKLVPSNIKRIVINSHMSENPVYLSDLEQGFLNGESDSVFVNPSSVVEKHYASNATFFGVDEPIVPRAFTSVAGPVYLRPGYASYMYAIEYSKILPAVKRRNANYSLFVISDETMRADSSLFIRPNVVQPWRYDVSSWDRAARQVVRRSEFELNLQMLNQVGTRLPRGVARKEFIPNLAGNFIVWNMEDIRVPAGPGDTVTFPPPTVSGGVPNVFGYNGDSIIGLAPEQLEEPTDNGNTYNVKGWFSFPRTEMYYAIREYSAFFDLIDRAGFNDDDFKKFTFTTDSELYTVFLPTDEAIGRNSERLDTMSVAELQQFVKYHFVPGNLIFTDGNALSGDYNTLRADEASTIYSTVFSTLDLRTGIDHIEILNETGGTIYDIEEAEDITNIMTVVNVSNDDALDNFVTTGVLHEIDTILIKH